MYNSSTKKGIIYTAVSFVLWGLFPLYWKLLEHLPALDILAHRIIWSFVFMCIVLAVLRQWKTGWKELLSLKKKGGFLSLLLASVLISINWFVYIWAVNHGFLLEASLGYYINPLVSVLLGILFLKERLNRLQIVAVSIAAAAVIISAFQYGSIPYIALLLAFSFGLYGLCKKRTSLPSAIGLTLETLLITPVALCYLLLGAHQSASGAVSGGTWLLLFFAGIFTALPLLLFAEGAKRLPLYQVGILQYIAPTITLLLGVFVYHEAFTGSKAFTFACIWAALLLFTFSQVKWKRISKSH
ncbi:EamA family transporter RarD [Bacillus atrophaeus]|uniref:EamA family transporter RarD n=1 Tax=Bacillus atrophaeus TaxID=1452 RepID=UPI000D04695F|nr:EamA family transporter RarD [Bacillus atrophaeus]MCY8499049.1 EamA family transporter RarD [Bacillus atrophaeus]MCY8811468.1 EamA family transporter RarD [Bacillus atrophaeus]MCY8822234.1 EamA family transporter RarD [Bacillus atrophaeus]MCY8829625.1 EamA family transporter RarD [Bacillus atrophaeus]MCY8834512.1 EamA family transporter RarD [Bacillus atrophaeus]